MDSSKDKYRSHHRKHKKEKKHKKHKKHRKHSSSSSSSEEEWVEKPSIDTDSKKQDFTNNDRDTWMTDSTFLFPTTHLERKLSKKVDKSNYQSYDPSKSVCELNPYWKDGGDGLPSSQLFKEFKKPSFEENNTKEYLKSKSIAKASGDWRKSKKIENVTKAATKDEHIPKGENDHNLSDKEINELAAKVLKAEILGNIPLAEKLKKQLEQAQEFRKQNPAASSRETDVILTVTDTKGQSCPLQKRSTSSTSSVNQKKKKVDTHVDRERVRYFGDDDKYSLNEMFEREKFRTGDDEDESFMKIASKLRNPNDDLEDIFSEKIQKVDSDEKVDARNRDKAIRQHSRMTESIDNCAMCIDSSRFNKDLLIKLGETVFLSLPTHQSLVAGHCLLSPIRHTPCSTQLDEDVWNEMQYFRRTLSKMFAQRDCRTVFFECAKNLNRYPHMTLECIPLPEEEGALAPMYFKKAILECEQEWSNNKKLVELKNSSVRRAIPKGLSYFAVEFDDVPGYAHVIEDRRDFPQNFAQEIIGGLLDLHHSVWRKRQAESAEERQRKVDDFKKMWQKFQMSQ